MAALVLAEDVAGARVRVLTLSNPAKKNAVDPGCLQCLEEELSRAAADQIRALVLAGEGNVFCSGYDLSEVGAGADRLHGNQNGLNSNDLGQPVGQPVPLLDAPLIRACGAIEASPIPIVAALDGPVFGAGAELACACDLRVASSSARFCLPPAKLSIVYSPEGTARIVRLLGLGQAKRLFLTAAVIDADEGFRIGFCEELTAEPSALPRAIALATQIAQLAPKTHAGMKRTYALLAPQLSGEAHAELEAIRKDAFQSADGREGRAAFSARRAPIFTGE
jgi:enoyl-CoA hydratase